MKSNSPITQRNAQLFNLIDSLENLNDTNKELFKDYIENKTNMILFNQSYLPLLTNDNFPHYLTIMSNTLSPVNTEQIARMFLEADIPLTEVLNYDSIKVLCDHKLLGHLYRTEREVFNTLITKSKTSNLYTELISLKSTYTKQIQSVLQALCVELGVPSEYDVWKKASKSNHHWRFIVLLISGNEEFRNLVMLGLDSQDYNRLVNYYLTDEVMEAYNRNLKNLYFQYTDVCTKFAEQY